MTKLLRSIDFWDLLLAAACLAVFLYAAIFVPNFVSGFNLSQLAASASEKALLILPMTLLIICREIDLSIASVLALTSVIFGLAVQAGMPTLAAIPLTLLFGALLGAFNGFLVSRLGLQSLVVTLGTMALYRGIGYILLGTGSVNILPPEIVDFGIDNLPGTQVPWTIVPFLILAPVFAVVLQKTATGKRLYALGGSPEVARYSGIDTRRMVLSLFVVSGVVAAIAGIVYTARLANARANNALGMELDVITIVLLGGVSVFGGKGKLTGVMLALVLIAIIRNVLALNQIGGDAQGMIIGLLLIGSLLIGNYWRSLEERLSRSRALRETQG
ncbi:ABC transporter permease [Mesorhizobium sp. CU2]|uniref:ABC transporter permease n=1 Tax=unclassified Mesorhizobium TaxID=325217 RepID=UPI0011279BEF|nr:MULTISPECIES: ABC transporter permease [unclassified Mesorhizobium]TPN76157.1 ABC transporter permease [Mesorhizobium sp. CU3]TPO10726.1 ABC transporter permease [Mesorhizobium sp. CU2]